MDRARLLLDILLDHAPTDAAKALVFRTYLETKAEPKDREIQLVGALYDGLRYGNWPWAITIRIK